MQISDIFSQTALTRSGLDMKAAIDWTSHDTTIWKDTWLLPRSSYLAKTALLNYFRRKRNWLQIPLVHIPERSCNNAV